MPLNRGARNFGIGTHFPRPHASLFCRLTYSLAVEITKIRALIKNKDKKEQKIWKKIFPRKAHMQFLNNIWKI